MSNEARDGGLSFFSYTAPMWSIGDHLDLALSFDDEPAFRAALAPLGIDSLAAMKIGGKEVSIEDCTVRAEVFGPYVSLMVGPDDQYSFLDASHWEGARSIERLLVAHDLVRHLAPERATSDVDVPIVGPPLRRPEYPPTDPASAARYVVTLGESVSGGWTTHTLKRLGVPHVTTFAAMDVTAETRVLDLALGRALDASALHEGLLAVASLSVGTRLDGTTGAVAARLELVLPDAALLAEAERMQNAFARAAIASDYATAGDLARAFLIRRAGGEPIELGGVVEEMLVAKLHGRACHRFDGLASVVATLLATFARLDLPCLFRAADAVGDAVASCASGTAPDEARARLFARTIDEAARSFERTGDARRYVPVRLPFTPEGPVHLVLREEQRRCLAEDGLVAVDH